MSGNSHAWGEGHHILDFSSNVNINFNFIFKTAEFSFSLWLSFVIQSNQPSENLFVQFNQHTGYTQFDIGDCATYPRYFFQSISDAVDIV